MDSNDRDDDGATDDYVPLLVTGTDDFQVQDIVGRADNYAIAAAALKKARDDNGNPLLQAVYDEAYRRAQVEADYYAGIKAAALSDSQDQRTQAERNATGADAVKPYSIASRNSAYVEASNKRATAGIDLVAKAKAREAATEATASAFQSPADFYNQLVARRQALKADADQKVANASKDGGTPSKQLTDAAEAAKKALDAADKVLADYQALFDGDDMNDPVAGLIDTLLETDGDDGQALVDAIGGTYGTAKDAKDAADKVAEDVAGLIGDDGAVGQNTAAIAKNAGDIEMLDGRVTQNEDDILTNAGNIAMNAENIMTNTTMIGENRGMIETNAADIMTNAGNISSNTTMIDANTSAIGANTSAIAGLDGRVGSNESAIGRNANMIGELNEALEVVRAGVAASMALAGMPAINGRGISIGVGSYDGESAFAVGFQIQSEMASFKVGVTSSGGETGASAGVGFQF